MSEHFKLLYDLHLSSMQRYENASVPLDYSHEKYKCKTLICVYSNFIAYIFIINLSFLIK